MKLLTTNTLMVLLILISGYGYIASCTHDDIVPPAQANPTPVITRGENVHLPNATGVADGDTTKWKLDKAHSSVLWSTAYVGAAGLLTGRFNQFGMHDVTNAKMLKYPTPSRGQVLPDTSWAFYENDPSKIYFNGYVQMNTSNTGEPGRDSGCILGTGYYNTVKIIPGYQNLEINNLAKIKTTKVEFDPLSNDYIVTFDFIWQGSLASPLTQSIVGRLKYIPKAAVKDAVTGNVLYSVFGLQLNFQFDCRDFGVTSTSVADVIDIECNMNFNNK
ncbi:hypothetical protein FRZ67_22145 [Panacibacter ginsenosidivorans]|uniref:Lipid/polyisoprenoid-binding YceI-like domain-containing protein n=1 Tax=Panacibacter ginsenosidivorans TaxID=1813871 RepID=A0A5B8VH18_9BACT|nr:hypothetical protein [Panacibacter ginsenosidivorans]QEC69866.1 hypothetical protein FRZ67_22145 [Panacibacter ginsenosidivorans]